MERVERDPIPLADLDKRLALLAKYGVRSYRDGLLSLDLDPSRARTKKQDGEQPFIPPP